MFVHSQVPENLFDTMIKSYCAVAGFNGFVINK